MNLRIGRYLYAFLFETEQFSPKCFIATVLKWMVDCFIQFSKCSKLIKLWVFLLINTFLKNMIIFIRSINDWSSTRIEGEARVGRRYVTTKKIFEMKGYVKRRIYCCEQNYLLCKRLKSSCIFKIVLFILLFAFFIHVRKIS